jgi:outer membrane protein assembly factor BamD (BamD/ComL family)
LNRFPKAQDAYDQLFVDYPSTRYVQPATKRLYQIAQNWLDLADPAHRSNIRTVSAIEVEFEDPQEVPPPPTTLSLRSRILPNFSDKTRPMFDTQGRALKALKGIWLNDPTGPLADDALMATASYYLRREDYVESDRYFKILRDEYPDSPHLKDAFLLGAHVRLMSYQGPAYDGTSLAGAEQLTEQSLNIYPNSKERPQLREDLQKLHLLNAQRAWHRVEYYSGKKDHDRSVGLSCVRLINEFPNTKFADMARDRLATLDHDELQMLPGFDRMLESLSEKRPRNEAPRPKVKSVSATADDLDRQGFDR